MTQFFPTPETTAYVQNIRQELIASNDPHLIWLSAIVSDLQLFLLCQSMSPDGDQPLAVGEMSVEIDYVETEG